MPGPTIVLDLADPRATSGFLTSLAGCSFWCDRPVGPEPTPAPRPDLPAPDPRLEGRTIYDGPGLVDGILGRIRSSICADGSHSVEYEDGERFWIASDGWRVVRMTTVSAGARAVERAIGAPLALALAARGVYLLHASALRSAGGVLALAAASGAGKSTLAAAAEEHPDLGLSRVADDLLPVRLVPEPVALPHFPQLKLPADRNYPSGSAPALPWSALVEIGHSADCAGIEIRRLGRAETCRGIVAATVAARLFDPDLLVKHFEACAGASARIVGIRLRYPSGRQIQRLPLEALAAWVASDSFPAA